MTLYMYISVLCGNRSVELRQHGLAFVSSRKHFKMEVDGSLSNLFLKVCQKKQLDFAVKEKQLQIMQHLIEKRNVLAALPTGYGKSVLYAVLPALLDEVRIF